MGVGGEPSSGRKKIKSLSDRWLWQRSAPRDLAPPFPKAGQQKSNHNYSLPTVVYRRGCSMIAVQLGSASVMPVDLSCLAAIDLGTLADAVLKLFIDVKV